MLSDKQTLRVSIRALEGDKNVLSGNGPGRQLLSRLIQEIDQPDGDNRPLAEVASAEPGPLFLDFDGVDVATSSYLRAGVIGFRDYCRNAGLGLYPVVANASQAILDDLSLLLEQMGEAFLVCRIDFSQGSPSEVSVLGKLESKQRLTLEAVIELGEADAAALAQRANDGVRLTAWNNRLAALVAKGLLMEDKKGRGKTYRPVLEMK